MFKYIGIRGHRGAGKNTFSCLLGAAIDFYLRHKSFTGFEEVYNDTVKRILESDGNDFLSDQYFNNVYFESFADTAKIMLSNLIGTPTHFMYDDEYKDSVIISMYDFSLIIPKESEKEQVHKKLELKTAEQLKELSDNNQITDNKNVYCTLRELISYFSKYVMRKSFGSNVWIKSLEMNQWDQEQFYASNGKVIYKIFTDCKFPSEISYIKNNKGTIIKVHRTNNIKNDTEISEELKNDTRFDFEFCFDDIHSSDTINKIKQLTINIIDND